MNSSPPDYQPEPPSHNDKEPEYLLLQKGTPLTYLEASHDSAAPTILERKALRVVRYNDDGSVLVRNPRASNREGER